MDLQTWAREEINRLVAAGVSLYDAQQAVDWVVRNLPAGENPQAWTPGRRVLEAVRINTESIQDAGGEWIASQPDKYKRLLYATPVDEPSIVSDAVVVGILAYLFLNQQAEYARADNLETISQETLSALMAQIEAERVRELMKLTESLQRGQISKATWIRQYQQVLQRTHLQLRALGAGGFRLMTDLDRYNIQRRLEADFVLLAKFADGIVDGTLTISQILNRISWYIGNAIIQFWEAIEMAFFRTGKVVIERNILHPAEHCEGPPNGCTYFSEMGWQPEGTIPPPKVNRKCKLGCKCSKRYKLVQRAELAQWIGTLRD